eukprot:5119683-Pleurochrysis_carterae.AAC.1
MRPRERLNDVNLRWTRCAQAPSSSAKYGRITHADSLFVLPLCCLYSFPGVASQAPSDRLRSPMRHFFNSPVPQVHGAHLPHLHTTRHTHACGPSRTHALTYR